MTARLIISEHDQLGGLGDDDHAQYLLLAGRSGGQIAHGGTLSTDHLDLRPNPAIDPPVDWTTDGFIKAHGRILFEGFTDLTATAGVNFQLMRHDETCDCAGQGSVIPQGFWFTPTMEYDTPQTFGGAAVFQDGSTWEETAAIGGAHSVFTIGSYLAGITYEVGHVGAGTPPQTLYGVGAQPRADRRSGSALVMPLMIAYQTNAVFPLKAFLGLEELRNGTVCTEYSHFRANSNIPNGMILHGGSTITTEIGLDLQNIAHGATAISIRSDAVGAYMEHAGPIRLNHDSNQLLFGTAQDVAIGRVAADVLGLAAGDSLRIPSGDLQLAEYMRHDGDSDTYWHFRDDRVTVVVGGETMLNLLEQAAAQDRFEVNPNAGDIDFQVYGDTGLIIGTDAAIDGLGFYGVTPVARAAAYTVANLTTDRSYDANSTTIDELADVLGTLIADLRTVGLIQ